MEPRNSRYVPLSDALSWTAFGDALDDEGLLRAIQGSLSVDARGWPIVPDHGESFFADRQQGLQCLETAFNDLRDAVERAALTVRGRHTSEFSLANAKRGDCEKLTGEKLATFSQVTIATEWDHSVGRAAAIVGLRHQVMGPTVIWTHDEHFADRETLAAVDRVRIEDTHGITGSPVSPPDDEGYLFVEVRRDQLMRIFPASQGSKRQERVRVPANRQLDHDDIIDRAREMLAEQPALTKGSAAASIIADLPLNPRNGKPRDQRHIERMIAPLWEGGF